MSPQNCCNLKIIEKPRAQAAAFVAAAGSCLSLLIVFATVPSVEKPRETEDKNVFNLSEVHNCVLTIQLQSAGNLPCTIGIPM